MIRLAALLALAGLAACSTPPDHFHTLRPSGAVPAPTHVPVRILSIGPVTIPDSLARDGWVIRNGDTGVQVHDHQLWTQGLQAEIAQALADQLNRGPLPDAWWADAGPTGSGAGTDLDTPALLRVRVQVLRFDGMFRPAPAIDDELRWTLECQPLGESSLPGGVYHVVRGGVHAVSGPAPEADPSVEETQQRYDRLARAHAQALVSLAAEIDRAVRDSAADRAQACAKPSAP